MNLQTRIVLICLGAVLLITALLAFGTNSVSRGEDFAISYGIIALISAAITLFVGLILLIVGNKPWAQGFLIAGGILGLTGFLTCGLTLNSLRL